MTKESQMSSGNTDQTPVTSKGVSRDLISRTRAILCERFPKAFAGTGQNKQPIKIGIDEDILLAMPELGRNALSLALQNYTWGSTYIRNVVAGAARIDLNGQPSGVVSEKEAEHAAARLRYFEKQKQKSSAATEKADAA